MNTATLVRSEVCAPNLALRDLAPGQASMLAEVSAGLAQPRKALPPKYFYDARGAELFSAICGTQAYYLTRTENSILHGCAPELARHIGRGATIVEFGAGEMRKVRALLPWLRPRRYVPVDLSREQLLVAAGALARAHPWLEVVAAVADYQAQDLGTLIDSDARSVVFFPGSTIGNLEPDEAVVLLRRMRALVGSDGGAIVGVDLVKAKAVLDAAYNDTEGFTREFNLNILAHINRELGGEFDLQRFAHVAFYDEQRSRIEMHLRSRIAQTVQVSGRRFAFAAGETIHTENSYKYRPEQFLRLARAAGFPGARMWTDAAGMFAVFYLHGA